MITVGVKELKNNLSRYLSQVKKGDDLLITERGRPVARIVREDPKNVSVRVALRPLIEKGLITLPARMIDRQVPSPVQVAGKSVSEMVIGDRR